MSHTPQDERDGLPSASGMDRYVHCPGAWAACRSAPPSPGGKLAVQGTRIHDAIKDDTEEDLEVDEAVIKANLQKLEVNALTQWTEDNAVDPIPSPLLREERLYFRAAKTLEPIATAKLDVAYLGNSSALNINYKTGFKIASDARGSWQLRTEMLCLWHTYQQLTHVRVAFAQSRLGDRYDYCDYDLRDIKHSEAELRHVLWKITLPGQPRNPGPWCAYCPAAATCPQASAYVLVVGLIVPLAGGVSGLTPEGQKLVWAQKGAVTAIFKSIEASLKALSDEDLAAIGMKREPNSDTRFVTDPQKLFELLYTNGLLMPNTEKDPDVSAREFHSWNKTTLGKLEKAVIPRLAAQKNITHAEAGKLLGELMKPVLGSNQRSPSLALND